MKKEKLKRALRYSHISQASDNNYMYAFQYKNAFEILFSSQASIDTIVLPMMYCLRHYVELMLKNNIEYFSKYSGSESMLNRLNNEHKLEPLVNAFKEHWRIISRQCALDYGDSHMDRLDSLIDELNTLDRLSMSFRYSHQKNGEKHFKNKWVEENAGAQTIDTYKLKKMLDKASLALVHTMDYFDDKMGLMNVEYEGSLKKHEHILSIKQKILGENHQLVNNQLILVEKIKSSMVENK